MPPTNVARTQPAYNQNNQISVEQPKVQHQEELPTNHHVETKETQETVKKDVPSTEGIILNIHLKLLNNIGKQI